MSASSRSSIARPRCGRIGECLARGRVLLARPLELVGGAPPARLERREAGGSAFELRGGRLDGGVRVPTATRDLLARERNPLQRLPDERGARPYSAYALLERADGLDLPRELLVAALELGGMGENRVGRCGCHVHILSAGPTMPTPVRRLAA